jgi:hypothetical protein
MELYHLLHKKEDMRCAYIGENWEIFKKDI